MFFWLEYRLAGRRDALYHVTQVLLHGLAAFLVLLVCLRLSGDRVAASIAALLFVLHPVHAFAATEPAARADVLFPVFYLLALLVFDSALRNRNGRGVAWKIVLTAFLYALSVLSKEMGITLPAVLVALVLLRHFADKVPLRRVVWTIPAWVTLVAFVVWRFVIIHLPPPTLG